MVVKHCCIMHAEFYYGKYHKEYKGTWHEDVGSNSRSGQVQWWTHMIVIITILVLHKSEFLDEVSVCGSPRRMILHGIIYAPFILCACTNKYQVITVPAA
jgi:hypothetical protein